MKNNYLLLLEQTCWMWMAHLDGQELEFEPCSHEGSCSILSIQMMLTYIPQHLTFSWMIIQYRQVLTEESSPTLPLLSAIAS